MSAPRGPGATIPPLLEAARFMAPVTTASALGATLFALLRDWQRRG